MTDQEPVQQTQASATGCKHCPTRELCECPATPEICAIGGKCPCDSSCPCPGKSKRRGDDCCPYPLLCGRNGAAIGLSTIALIVITAIARWTNSPFAALALLLALVPMLFATGLALAAFGKWGGRATDRFEPALPVCSVFWLLGGVFPLLAAFALFGDGEKLAAAPLIIVGLLFLLVAWQCPIVVACRLMHPVVLMGLLLGLIGAGGFGILALVRANEVFAGLALLGIGMWLVLVLAIPWFAVCRTGSQRGRLFPGAGLIFVLPIAVLIVALAMLVTNGLPRVGDESDGGATRVVAAESDAAGSPSATPTATPTPSPTPTPTATPVPPTPDTPTTETSTETDEIEEADPAIMEVPLELSHLGEMLGVSEDRVMQIYEHMLATDAVWVTDGNMPERLGPNMTYIAGGTDGSNVVVIFEFDGPLMDTGKPGAGSQVQFLVSLGSMPTSTSDADQLWALMPGSPVDGYRVQDNFSPIEGGSGATYMQYAMFVIPDPGPNAYFRGGHFYRDTPDNGAATDGDRTAETSTEVLTVDTVNGSLRYDIGS